jgi:hypothetical protein
MGFVMLLSDDAIIMLPLLGFYANKPRRGEIITAN